MIQLMFIVSFVVLFIHIIFWRGMIFENIGEYLRKALPEFIQKPLFECPICMAPWHGMIILLIGKENHLWVINSWVEFVLVLFGSGGINAVLIYIIEQGKSINKTLNDMDCNCTKKLTEEEKSEERKKRISAHALPDNVIL